MDFINIIVIIYLVVGIIQSNIVFNKAQSKTFWEAVVHAFKAILYVPLWAPYTVLATVGKIWHMTRVRRDLNADDLTIIYYKYCKHHATYLNGVAIAAATWATPELTHHKDRVTLVLRDAIKNGIKVLECPDATPAPYLLIEDAEELISLDLDTPEQL